jgi:apolipoprotein N-acyltransferase
MQPGRAYLSRGALSTYIALSGPAAEKGARLIVWPELGLTSNPCAMPAARDELRSGARRLDAMVAVGFGNEGQNGHNQAIVFTPDGRCLGPYSKHHPDPRFAERFVVDTSYLVYRTPLGSIATLVCFDSDFTDSTRAVAAEGARLVAVPTADVEGIARIHYTEMVFRAIENRVAVVKGDEGWDSAVFDPYGRVVASMVSDHDRAGVLVADVALGPGGRTLWNRLASTIEIAGLAIAAIGLVAAGRQLPRRARRRA